MTQSEKIPWKRLAAEGAAIVVSILLAFWIDAWWEQREERQLLIGNLQALEKEIEANQRNIEQGRRLFTRVFESMDRVFAGLAEEDTEALPDDFLTDVGEIYLIWLSQITNSAYEVVLSPESLRLIKSVELRNHLVEANKQILGVDESRRRTWSEFLERHGPYLASLGIISKLGWSEAQEEEVQSGILNPLPETPYATDPSVLRTREYWISLEQWRVHYFDYVWEVLLLKQTQETALELLREEISVLTGEPAA